MVIEVSDMHLQHIVSHIGPSNPINLKNKIPQIPGWDSLAMGGIYPTLLIRTLV